MADILLDNQALPSSNPASGKSIIGVDSTTKRPYQMDDGGNVNGLLSKKDTSASQSSIATTDVYITNSNIQVPSFGMKVGQVYRWMLMLDKTNAGTTAFVLNVRLGAAGAIGDTSRLALTQNVAQAAVTSAGIMIVLVQVRAVSASVGVIAGGFAFCHVTAFGDGKQGVSSNFDNSAVGGQYIGLSFTTGASAVWSITACTGELVG